MKNWYLVLKNLKDGNKMGLNVLNNWLYINNQAVQSVPCDTAKYDADKTNTVQYIVHHYTASTTAKSAHQSYQDPTTQASWHLTIDRDGNVYQLLGFDKVAWHAGESAYGGFNFLNPVSIGIEHVNAGPLTMKNQQLVTWTGQPVANQDVYLDSSGNSWMNYTQQQIQASAQVTLFLARTFKVRDIVSHSQICVPPGRKQDTGPAWQSTLNSIRQAYLGAGKKLR